MPKYTLRIILISAILGLVVAGVALAKNPWSGPKVESHIKDVPKTALKQKVLIEETGNDTHILIKAAQVTEITASSSSVTTPDFLKVKVFGQDYKIQITSDTNTVRYHWDKSKLPEFSVGDVVNAYGTLDETDPFLVHAETVRDVSIQFIHGVFLGEITDITYASPATSVSSFILKTESKGNQTVIVNEKTKVYDGKIEKALSDLQVGIKVLVRGAWDKTLSKISALIIRISPTKVDNEH